MAEEKKEVEAAPKKGKLKLILIIVAALLLVGASAGAAWYFLVSKPAAEASRDAQAGSDDGHGTGKGDKKSHRKKAGSKTGEGHAQRIFVPLDQFVVNLHDSQADRYAQIAMVIEVDDPAAETGIKAAMPAIRNAILLLISSRSAQDLLTLDGKEQLAIDVALASYAVLEGEQPPRPTPSEPAAGATAGAPAHRRTFDDVDTGPITAVHFSQFIVQ